MFWHEMMKYEKRHELQARASVGDNNLIKQFCKFDNAANSYIRVEVGNFTKQQILNYYNSISTERRILLFGSEGVFKQVKIIDNSGEAIIFNNYILVN